MRPRRSAVLLAAALGAAGAGCRHAGVPPAPLPPDWRTLAHAPSPFAALYRFSFGGQRNLVLTVRSGAGRLSLSVAVPPGGVAFAAWITDDEGWVERVKERCREPLPRGVIPLSKDASLPLDPHLAALRPFRPGAGGRARGDGHARVGRSLERAVRVAGPDRGASGGLHPRRRHASGRENRRSLRI